jgi:hypothetical protein
VLTDTGNLLTVGGTAESGVEKGYLVTAGYFGGQIAHDGAFLKGLGLFGKVVSIVGTAASVFILIKDAIAGNVTPSDVLNVGMGGTGIALAFVELPGWGLALGSAQLLLAWYDYTSELTAEMAAKLTPPINGIEWQVDELIRIVNENAAADYEQELRDYKDWSYGQSHACFVLGARDRDADADTLMRNAGDGIIVDGPP